jgi:DnaK suppressor protein
VTKSPAKSKAPPKKAASKPAAAAKKKAPAPAKKKPAPAKKPAAKPAPKAAAKAPPKPAPKAAAKPATKPAAKPAAKTPLAKADPKKNAVPALVTPKTPAKPIAPAAKPVRESKASARAAASSAATAVLEPAPASRFADRFAPMRPTRPIAIDAPVRPAAKIDPKLVNVWKVKAGRDLTEPELLAMPDGEYMNEKQLEFFRTRLTALKDDLLSNAGETTEHLREDTSIVPDPADRATIEEEHALELRTRDRERKLLKKISQSLARIEAGDYGYCDETGEPIGLGRLLARPTATLSLEAQQRREMKQKMFGD